MRKATTILAAAWLAACGDPSGSGPGGSTEDPVVFLSHGSGTTDVTTGAATAYPMTAVEAISYVQNEPCPTTEALGPAFGLSFLIIELDNAPGRCGRLTEGADKASSGLVRIRVARTLVGGGVPGLRLGTYQVPQAVTLEDGTVEEAHVYLLEYGSACTEFEYEAGWGTVTIDSADALGVTGSLSVEDASGSFATKPCGLDVFDGCSGDTAFPVTTRCYY